MSCIKCPRYFNNDCSGFYFLGKKYENCQMFTREYTEKELWKYIESGKGLPKIQERQE